MNGSLEFTSQEVLQVPELMKLLRAKFGKSSRLLLILEPLSCDWRVRGSTGATVQSHPAELRR
jgi:hypothetical protein